MSSGWDCVGRPKRFIVAAVAAAFVLALAGSAGARADEAAGRVAELERQVEELRAAVAALQAQQQAAATAPATEAPAAGAIGPEELARRLEVLAAEIEQLKLGETSAVADRSDYGYGPAASKVYREQQGLSIGGYGEAVYEQFAGRNDAGGPGRTDASDALRAIVYVGYKFNDRLVFNSEVEFEHGGQETFLEFAYLDYLWRPELNFRAGHLLMPMGLVNELHEPTIFLGVRRPILETTVLPSTWHENGLGVFGDVGPLSYRSYVVNGFRANGFSAGGLRSGRQAGNRAISEDFAWVTRLDYRPVEGVLVGGSAYLGDSGQGLTAGGEEVDVSTRIVEAHAEWRFRGLELRGLWAQAELDDVARLNAALGLTGNRSVGEELGGWYAQVGYDVLSQLGSGEWQLTPFVRWEEVDTQKAVPAGFARSGANDQEILTYGLELQPEERVVLKLDFQDFDNAAGTGVDQWSLGLGYVF
jgi:outer membrane murein-binding lipoprotein Lpp